MIRQLIIFAALVFVSPLLAEEDNGGSSGSGTTASESQSATSQAPGESSSKTEEKSSEGESSGEKAPKAEAKPLISDPPKKLDSSKSSKKRPKKKKKKKKKLKRKKRKKKKPSGAKSKAAAKKKTKGQWGVVQTDGAAAYKVPNFDSPVLEYLSAGQKVRISQKLYQGIGGFGAFFKVRVGVKTYGYVADVDVAPEYKPQKKGPGKPTHVEKNPNFKRDPRQPPEEKLPIFFTRYIGGTFGMVNFTEKFSGRKFGSSEWMAGVRMTGPGTLAEGLPLDSAFLFNQGAPKFYKDEVSGGNPSGFFILGDIFLPYPFLETEDSLLSFGLGFMATYTKFSVQIKNTIFDSQELRGGLAGQIGFSLRFDRYILRLEGKYYYEKTDYLGYFVTFMGRY